MKTLLRLLGSVDQSVSSDILIKIKHTYFFGCFCYIFLQDYSAGHLSLS